MNRPATLLLYAMPAVPLAFLGLPLYVYLPAHYAALPGIGLSVVGVVLLLARLIDLVTDPLVGLLSDGIRHRVPPQALMTPGGALLIAGAWWLFQPPADAGALYLFGALGATYLGWTLLAIPYYALGVEVGVRQGQTHVAAWREAGMIVGTVGALLVPVLWSELDGLAGSARVLAWLAPPAVLLVWLLPAGGSRPAWRGTATLAAIWRQTSRPARQLLGIHLLNALAGGTAATLFVIYTRDVIGLDSAASGLLLLLYFAAGLVCLPAWVAYARRAGQTAAWRAAMLLASIAFLPAAFLGNGDQMAFALVCILTGATLGADIALPAAIQAQIVVEESQRLRRARGATLFGLWGMTGKLALALSAGLALPLLGLLSHPLTGLQQAQVTPWLYAFLPALIKLLAIAALQRSGLPGRPAATDSTPMEVPDVPNPTVRPDRPAVADRRL